MEIGVNYKAKLIDVSARNLGGKTNIAGTKDKRWAVVVGKEETIVCFIEGYFKSVEGIAKGLAASLNSNDRIKLNVEI